jgi:hypothetical protein
VAVNVSGNAVTYAKALATLEQLRAQPQLALAANSLSLVKRIRRLVAKPATRTRFPASWLISVSTLAALLLVTGFWLYPQLTQAQTSPASLRVFDRNGKEITEEIAPHVFGMIREELVEKLGRDALEQNLNVYSTIDLQAQQAANEASLNAEMPPGAQMAVVGIDPSTGGVLAVVGEHLRAGQKVGELNRASQSYRQIAHSFKPVVYATAFEQAGFTQATVLVDEPTAFKVPGHGDYEPANHDGQFMGSMTVRKALDVSRSIPVVKAMEAVTTDAVVAKAKELGYANAVPYWSLALGSIEATPLQHTAAFGSFANGGVYNEPFIISRVEDRAGNILYETTPVSKRVWSEQTAYLTLDLMHGNVVDEGAFSRRAVIEGRWVAGKTGTSNDESDIWFVGMTPGIVASVWIGYDDNSSIPKKIDPALTRAGDGTVNSSRQPIYIWHDFVEGALVGKPVEEYPVPEGITFKNIDLTTGEPGSVRAAFLAQSDESMTQPDVESSRAEDSSPEPESEQATQPLQKQIWLSFVGSEIEITKDFPKVISLTPGNKIIFEIREHGDVKRLETWNTGSVQYYKYTLNDQVITDVGTGEIMTEFINTWDIIKKWQQQLEVPTSEANNSPEATPVLMWAEAESIPTQKGSFAFNAFGESVDGNTFISYIYGSDASMSLDRLSKIGAATPLDESLPVEGKYIDSENFSALEHILQATQIVEHDLIPSSGPIGHDFYVKNFVTDLLDNVKLNTEEMQATLELINTIQSEQDRKELLLKYLDKVSATSKVGLEQPSTLATNEQKLQRLLELAPELPESASAYTTYMKEAATLPDETKQRAVRELTDRLYARASKASVRGTGDGTAINYNGFALVVTSKDAVAIVDFFDPFDHTRTFNELRGVAYRYRALQKGGQEQSGEGIVYENYQSVPSDNPNEFSVIPSQGGDMLWVNAGPIIFEWSHGSDLGGWVYVDNLDPMLENENSFETFDLHSILAESETELESNRVYEHPYLLPSALDPLNTVETTTEVNADISLKDLEIRVAPIEEDLFSILNETERIAPDENAREVPFSFDPEKLGLVELQNQPYTLRLIIQDERGEHEVLNETMQASESLSTSITVAGEATAQLLINDVLFMAWNP